MFTLPTEGNQGTAVQWSPLSLWDLVTPTWSLSSACVLWYLNLATEMWCVLLTDSNLGALFSFSL